MATNVFKVKSINGYDVFTYRDIYNEEHTTSFPTAWDMTEQEAEDWLNDLNL